MATTAPTRETARAMVRSRAWAPGLAVVPAALTVFGVATVLRLVYDPWYLNYDARYALLWARDLARGVRPEYLADFAPTPHPLQTAVSWLALPLGDAADGLLVWLVLLSFGLLVWLVYRLGATAFHPWAGVVAAAVVATRPALQRDALLGYQDVPFAALVVGAVLLASRAPRRPAAVLGLLALAGLLRPEAWLLSALYVAYAWRATPATARAGRVALAAAAPTIWIATDWLVTGDPLHSMHGTAALAEAMDRRRHVSDAPYWTAMYFGFVLREPLVVGVPLGLLFAWRHRRRAATLPLAAATAMTVAFAALPLFGLPLVGRYVRTPAILLALFYGLAVCGWMRLPSGRPRRAWLAVGVLAAALSLAFVPTHASMLEGVERRMTLDGALYGELRAAARAPAVRRAFAACAPLSTLDHRPIPHLRWWLGGDPGSVGTVADGASPLGRVLLLPRRGRLTRRLYRGGRMRRVERPASYRRVFRNRWWRVYAAPGCVTRPRA